MVTVDLAMLWKEAAAALTYYPVICQVGQRKTTTDLSVAYTPAHIYAWNFPNASLQRYRYIRLPIELVSTLSSERITLKDELDRNGKETVIAHYKTLG
jgi:hypothetical protein